MATVDSGPIVHLPPALFLQHYRMKTNGFPILRSSVEDCDTGFDIKLVVSHTEMCPFICTICKGFPRYPTELCNCGHIFCYYCITKIRASSDDSGQRKSKKCPNCRYVFNKFDIISFEKTSAALCNIYSSYDIRCPNQCGHISSPKAMIKHETMECQYRTVLCTSDGCHTELPEDQMQQHLVECSKRFVYCSKCRIPIVVNDLHHKCIESTRPIVKSVLLSKLCNKLQCIA